MIFSLPDTDVCESKVKNHTCCCFKSNTLNGHLCRSSEPTSVQMTDSMETLSTLHTEKIRFFCWLEQNSGDLCAAAAADSLALNSEHRDESDLWCLFSFRLAEGEMSEHEYQEVSSQKPRGPHSGVNTNTTRTAEEKNTPESLRLNTDWIKPNFTLKTDSIRTCMNHNQWASPLWTESLRCSHVNLERIRKSEDVETGSSDV